jgi:enoyl-CoA hydratase
MPVLLTDLDGHGVATVTVNRPEALNALNAEVLDALAVAAKDLAGKAKAIIVTGAGKAFVAEAFARRGHRVGEAFAAFPGPIVAAINGYALGGGFELAMCCDILVASEKAVVGQPEAKLGVVPGFGGSQRLPRRVGPGIAKWMLMTGESVKADEALRLGLVDKVVPHDALMAECRKLVDACLANGPLAVASVKHLVDQGLDLPLPKALDLEAKAFGASFATADQKEGMKAFLEKRKANYAGR